MLVIMYKINTQGCSLNCYIFESNAILLLNMKYQNPVITSRFKLQTI